MRGKRGAINVEYILLMVVGALAVILGLGYLASNMSDKHSEVAGAISTKETSLTSNGSAEPQYGGDTPPAESATVVVYDPDIDPVGDFALYTESPFGLVADTYYEVEPYSTAGNVLRADNPSDFPGQFMGLPIPDAETNATYQMTASFYVDGDVGLTYFDARHKIRDDATIEFVSQNWDGWGEGWHTVTGPAVTWTGTGSPAVMFWCAVSDNPGTVYYDWISIEKLP